MGKDEWRSLPCPPAGTAPRILHSAVWTGSEMLLWRGVGAFDVATFDTAPPAIVGLRLQRRVVPQCDNQCLRAAHDDTCQYVLAVPARVKPCWVEECGNSGAGPGNLSGAIVVTGTIIAVQTQAAAAVPMQLEASDERPDDRFDKWDYVVECGTQLVVACIAITSPTVGEPEARTFTVGEPGTYRVRVYIGGLDANVAERDSKEYYRRCFWSVSDAEANGTLVLKAAGNSDSKGSDLRGPRAIFAAWDSTNNGIVIAAELAVAGLASSASHDSCGALPDWLAAAEARWAYRAANACSPTG